MAVARIELATSSFPAQPIKKDRCGMSDAL